MLDANRVSTDPAWFPVDLHVPDRVFRFLEVTLDAIERSTFLDTRIEAPLDLAQAVPMGSLPLLPSPPRLDWIFHTSFCGSTLLARALHVAPEQVVLREPLVFRRLGDARRSGWRVEEFLAPVVGLLGREWTPGGRVIVKPTHAALNVAADLMSAVPQSRAMMLGSPLSDFLVSNLKKTRETQAKIPELAERALSASRLGPKLPRAALAPPGLLEAAVLQWAAQRELSIELVERTGEDRIMFVDAQSLFADPAATALRCARWFGSTVDPVAIERVASTVAGRNAKAPDVPYSARQRLEEAAHVRARYDSELRRAHAWFEAWVLPHMSPRAAGHLGG